MRIEHSITIERPIEEVFAFSAAPENYPLWVSAILGVESTSAGPVETGSTFVEDTKALGLEFSVQCEVVAYEPPHLFAWRGSGGPMSIELRHSCDPIDGGTKVTAVQEVELDGVFRLAGPAMSQYLKRTLEGDFTTLKELLEGAPAAGGDDAG
ncbi:MAG: SRPBCC family protein [Chloroflexi bacterium]|nr:SRPBCC family protein [Chloroflexota bacterium]